MKKRTKSKIGKPLARWTIPEPLDSKSNQKLPDLGEHLLDLHRAAYQSESKDKGTDAGWAAFVSQRQKQFTQYQKKLIELSPDLMTDRELSQLDIIDAYGLKDTAWPYGLISEHIAYAASLDHPVYAFVPCFVKGLFILPDIQGTVKNYAMFEILNINEDQESVQIRIHDYCRPGSEYEPGIQCTVKIKYRPDDYPDIVITDTVSFTDLYSRIQPKTLGWDRKSCRYWEKIFLQNTVDQTARFRNLNMDPFLTLAQRFASGMLAVNAGLSSKRPVVQKDIDPDQILESDKPKSKKPEAQPKPVLNIQNNPERRVRTIGMIKFASQAAPKPAVKAVRNYKLASWTARGHIRRYKNGKQVYIQPVIKHRRAAGNQVSPAPTTIVIKNNAKEGDIT